MSSLKFSSCPVPTDVTSLSHAAPFPLCTIVVWSGKIDKKLWININFTCISTVTKTTTHFATSGKLTLVYNFYWLNKSIKTICSVCNSEMRDEVLFKQRDSTCNLIEFSIVLSINTWNCVFVFSSPVAQATIVAKLCQLTFRQSLWLIQFQI